MKNITLATALAAACLVLSSQVLKAENYLFHPNSIVVLGQRFDPANPTDDKANGLFEFVGEKTLATSGKFTQYLRVVDSRKSLFEATSIDAGLEVRSGMFSGKAKFSSSRTNEFSEETLVFVFHVKYSFGQERGGEYIKFSDRGEQFLKVVKGDSEKEKRFIDLIYPEVVTQLERGSMTNVIYTIQLSDKSLKRQMQSSLKAKWAGGKAGVNLASEIEKVDKNATYEVNIEHSRDIGFVEDIADLITHDPGNLPLFMEALRKSCSNLKPEDCPIIGFSTQKISDIPDVAFALDMQSTKDSIALNNSITSALLEIREHYDSVAFKHKAITNLLASKRDPDFAAGGKDELVKAQGVLQARLKEIESRAVNLRASKSIKDITAEFSPLPDLKTAKHMKKPFARLTKWVRASSTKRSRSEHYNFYFDYSPVIELLHPELVHRARLSCRVIDEASKPSALVKELGVLASVPGAKLSQIAEAAGDFSQIWQRKSMHLDKYRWGGHHDQMVKGFKHFGDQSDNDESKLVYTLEIEDIDGEIHQVDLQNFVLSNE